MDLTTALLQLERTSARRKTARRSLREATDVVASAILDRTRTGDSATIYRVDPPQMTRADLADPRTVCFATSRDAYEHHFPLTEAARQKGYAETIIEKGERGRVTEVHYSVVRVTWPVSQWAGGARAFLCPQPAATLVRGDAVLLDVRDGYHDGSNSHNPVGRSIVSVDEDEQEEETLHLATDGERERFAEEAGAVIAQLAVLYEREARDMEAAATAVAKVVPR